MHCTKLHLRASHHRPLHRTVEDWELGSDLTGPYQTHPNTGTPATVPPNHYSNSRGGMFRHRLTLWSLVVSGQDAGGGRGGGQGALYDGLCAPE